MWRVACTPAVELAVSFIGLRRGPTPFDLVFLAMAAHGEPELLKGQQSMQGLAPDWAWLWSVKPDTKHNNINNSTNHATRTASKVSVFSIVLHTSTSTDR